jgi:hypothetical protein
LDILDQFVTDGTVKVRRFCKVPPVFTGERGVCIVS